MSIQFSPSDYKELWKKKFLSLYFDCKRDETAMFIPKQMKNVAQILHNNNRHIPKTLFRYCSFHQHGHYTVPVG